MKLQLYDDKPFRCYPRQKVEHRNICKGCGKTHLRSSLCSKCKKTKDKKYLYMPNGLEILNNLFGKEIMNPYTTSSNGRVIR